MTDSDSDPISWKTLRYGTPVFGTDGKQAGLLREVLGSDAEDIFHGIRVELDQGGRNVMVPADQVTAMTAKRIDVGLAAAALEASPTYEDEATYHLASVGWLRKHVGWTKDSDSDEEPG
jgi:hypothetical protein